MLSKQVRKRRALERLEAAIVYTVDHPNLTTKHKWRKTSPVVRITQHTPNGPVFETLNSIYKPAATDETLPKAAVKRVPA